jgi:hypothetical protein
MKLWLGGAGRFGYFLEESLVRIRTLNGASHIKPRFAMKLRASAGGPDPQLFHSSDIAGKRGGQ